MTTNRPDSPTIHDHSESNMSAREAAGRILKGYTSGDYSHEDAFDVAAALLAVLNDPTEVLPEFDWKVTRSGFACDTLLGRYVAFEDDGGFYWMWPKIKESETCIKVGSIDEAKAACFAHFRQQIKSCFRETK